MLRIQSGIQQCHLFSATMETIFAYHTSVKITEGLSWERTGNWWKTSHSGPRPEFKLQYLKGQSFLIWNMCTCLIKRALQYGTAITYDDIIITDRISLVDIMTNLYAGCFWEETKQTDMPNMKQDWNMTGREGDVASLPNVKNNMNCWELFQEDVSETKREMTILYVSNWFIHNPQR